MGNIEIREQSNPKRRTQIFTDRNSIQPNSQPFRNSLAQRHSYNHAYSPIRYSKKSTNNYQPLTQRKVNTDRYEPREFQKTSTYFLQQQQPHDYKKHLTSNSKASNMTKIRSLQTQNFPQQYDQQEQQINSFNLSGKIVSNSRRVNNQRKIVKSINSNLNRQLARQRQGRMDNPIENKEIIKKVRNFNDFLNEIKRKLKQDKQQNLFKNKYRFETYSRPLAHQEISQPDNFINNFRNLNLIEHNEEQKGFEKTKSTRKIQVALKLQNQKLQLQKYRKLVQRQLSKTHSIENISLCTRNSGQKILTIQYQSILPHNVLSIQNSKASLKNQLSEKSLMAKPFLRNSNFIKVQQKYQLSDINEIQENSNKKQQRQKQREQMQRQSEQKEKQRQILKKLKNEYEKIKRNMFQLGELIQNYENGIQSNGRNKKRGDKILIKQQSLLSSFSKVSSMKNNSNRKIISSNSGEKRDIKPITQTIQETSSQNKIQKIEGLFQKLSDLQQQCQETDRQIRQAIQNSQQDSNVQESVRYNFSSFAPNS